MEGKKTQRAECLAKISSESVQERKDTKSKKV